MIKAIGALVYGLSHYPRASNLACVMCNLVIEILETSNYIIVCSEPWIFVLKVLEITNEWVESYLKKGRGIAMRQDGQRGIHH